MSKLIEIDPITRLEGHGKIEIFMDDSGKVEKAYYSIPELRGFEVFSRGKMAENMPQITSRICGVCPTAHHMASTRSLDSLYNVEPTDAAHALREMLYNMFMFEDHTLHFYILGGPDFIVGPNAPAAERNILGVIGKVGVETGKKVIGIRRKVRELMTWLTGKVIHPVWGLPGGVSKPLTKEMQKEFIAVAKECVEFAAFTKQALTDIVLSNQEYLDLILSDIYTHKTYYMGLVDEQNKINFYRGKIRVVDPEGNEFAKFDVKDYQDHLSEHVEPWTYVKFLFLKNVGWNGFNDGPDSGVYSVAPMARLNVSDGFTTPKAQALYEEYMATFMAKPVHHTLANHWARVIEIMYASERVLELASSDLVLSDDIINRNYDTPTEGFGVVEAPRGTLFHHLKTDENGLITDANLLVATQNNAARIAMSVEKAAKGLIHGADVDQGTLNMIEMAFRAYDPCNACSTHTAPGRFPLELNFRSSGNGKVIKSIKNY
jgi:F420-non-reducing hydrogenase large subunit